MSDQGQLHDNPKFGRVPEKLMHDTRITDGAIRLFAHMVWRYGRTQKNFEGRQSIADFLDVSQTTITNRIQELESTDWIITIDRGKNPVNGNYRTPFYHVFLSQEQCRKFRQSYQCKEGEAVRPKPEITTRKTRKGVGGNPKLRVNSSSHGWFNHRVNSSSPRAVNLSLCHPFNLSWRYLYTWYLDSLELDTDKAASSDASPEITHSEEYGKQPQPETTEENTKTPPASVAPPSINDGISAYIAGLIAPPASNQFVLKTNRSAVECVLAAGFSLEQITAYTKVLQAQQYWKGKKPPLTAIADGIAAHYATHSPKITSLDDEYVIPDAPPAAPETVEKNRLAYEALVARMVTSA